MPGKYITRADYEAIRKRINHTLDDTMLPDATIALDIYSGKAEDDVVAQLENPDGLTAAEQVKVKRSCISRCAAELIPAVRSTYRRMEGEVSAEVEKREWVALQQYLFESADAEIAGLVKPANESSTSSGTFMIFDVADGGR